MSPSKRAAGRARGWAFDERGPGPRRSTFSPEGSTTPSASSRSVASSFSSPSVSKSIVGTKRSPESDWCRTYTRRTCRRDSPDGSDMPTDIRARTRSGNRPPTAYHTRRTVSLLQSARPRELAIGASVARHSSSSVRLASSPSLLIRELDRSPTCKTSNNEFDDDEFDDGDIRKQIDARQQQSSTRHSSTTSSPQYDTCTFEIAIRASFCGTGFTECDLKHKYKKKHTTA